MGKEFLEKVVNEGVDSNLNSFFCDVSNNYVELGDDLPAYDDDRFTDFRAIGEIVFNPNEKLVVVTASVSGDLTERSAKKAQYEKAKKILKDFMKYDAGIFVFSDAAGSFRFSLVYGQAQGTKRVFSNFRRFTYFVSRGQTNKTFYDRIGKCDFSSLDAIKDAFSVEKVNKEFYQQIARYYYRLTGKNGYPKELVLSSVEEGDDKKYEEFAVRLIGRIIFCWFLRHKKSSNGIPLIPSEVLSLNAAQKQQQYYHFILEPLFFEVMNRPVKERKPVIVPQSELIPFLNGGLFEPHNNDYYEKDPNWALKIPDRWFVDFFSVLEQYNFTIDENSTVDADVSVDPEMLGRIFENLLAEVVPETGETARKATGSYYTPRAIVDYMVEQSLKQYLLTKASLPADKLDSLLSYEDENVDLSDSEKKAVVTALKEIKIIDPACGSGAFPMGILHRMLLVLEKVDPKLEIWRRQYLDSLDPMVRQVVMKNIRRENWVYIRKLMIIRDSIYGVDIQSLAVEIAKLRCFLSLVVDEMVLDNEENRGIEPLPNLEFKFVAANTLIGLPAKIEDFGAFETRDLTGKLRTLRIEYLTGIGETKEQLKKEFIQVQAQLRSKIDWALPTSQSHTLATWDPFSYKSCGWFDPEWMFGVNDGFDIVIANPPYINVQGLGEFADIYRRYFNTAYGSYDIYILFFEKSLELLKERGVVTFITSNKYFIADYGVRLRQHILQNSRIISLVDLADCVKVFESCLVSPAITILSKEKADSCNFPILLLKDNDIDDIHSKKPHPGSAKMFVNSKNNIFDIYIKGDNSRILDKMLLDSSELDNIADVRTGIMGFEYWDFEPFIVDGYKKNHLRIITNSHLDRYVFLFGKKINLYKKEYFEPYIDVHNAPLNPKTKQLFLSKKIIVRGVARRLSAQIDSQGYAALVAVHTIISKNQRDYDNRYLLALINSELFNWYHLTRFYTARIPRGSLRYPISFLSAIPIKKPVKHAQLEIVNYVDQILAITKDADYLSNTAKQARVKELELQIDRLVYELYGLTEEEIAVVEGVFKKQGD